MLVCFTARAKPGKEKEFETLVNDPEIARAAATAMGATRNMLFLQNGRMVRVLEFPEGVNPRPLGEVAKQDPRMADFFRKLGPLVEPSFDVDQPGSLEAFNKALMMPLALDVRL